jgi:butyryl-CoA dehydrogenase/short/branched chain acyl-CoA dehydrogenase
VDPAVGVLVDVQNTLVINALVRWGTAEQQRQHLSRLARDTVGAYACPRPAPAATRSRLRRGPRARGDGFVLDGRKLWITNAAEAGVFIVFATVDPAAGYKASPRSSSIAARRLHRRSQGRQARHPRQQHLRAAVRRVPVPRAQVLGEVGKGTRSRSRR